MPTQNAPDALTADPASSMLAQPDRPALNALAAQDPRILSAAPSPWLGGVNYDAAMKQLKLNQQEQFLYGMHMQNLQAGGVPNQGKTSTLFAATFEIDGRNFVIPTVWYGKIVKPDEALQNAKDVGLQNFPSYKTEGEARSRYDAMHGFMERDLSQ